MKDIGSNHIQSKHNLSTEQFKLQYPNQPLVSEELMKQKQIYANSKR